MAFASRRVFFSCGVTSACFMSDGSVDDSSDRLMMLTRVGAMMLMFVFSSVAGKGSRDQDLFTSRMMAVVHVNADRVQCS